MKSKKTLLIDIRHELDRFSERLDNAIKEQTASGNFSNRNYAAAKRGSMDLKNELTKLTQDAKYIYS